MAVGSEGLTDLQQWLGGAILILLAILLAYLFTPPKPDKHNW